MLQNKDDLERMLDSNPEHRLMLLVDPSIVENNVLSLSVYQIPPSLKHLIIRDVHHEVKSIGDNFLFDRNAYNLGFRINLESFDTAGLTSLERIGDNFLTYATNLRHFDTAGLTSLRTIGDAFLYKTNKNVTFMGLEHLPPQHPLRRVVPKPSGHRTYGISNLLKVTYISTL